MGRTEGVRRRGARRPGAPGAPSLDAGIGTQGVLVRVSLSDEAELCALSCMSVMFQWKASGGNGRRGAGQRWAREVRGPDARRQGAAAAPPAVRTGASRGPCRWHCRQGGALPGRHGGGRGSPAEGRDAATPVTPNGAPSTRGGGAGRPAPASGVGGRPPGRSGRRPLRAAGARRGGLEACKRPLGCHPPTRVKSQKERECLVFRGCPVTG